MIASETLTPISATFWMVLMLIQAEWNAYRMKILFRLLDDGTTSSDV